jgi:hypothetical protein
MRRSVLFRAYVFVGLCLVAGSTIGQTATEPDARICYGETLRRPCAERVISAAVSPMSKIQLSLDAFKAGSGLKNLIWGLTDSGVIKPIGVGLNVFDGAAGGISLKGGDISLKEGSQLHVHATVKEIAYQADPSAQIVEFVWNFEDKEFASVVATMGLPGDKDESAARFAECTGLKGGNHPGQALFRRYDDGWRLVNNPTICADKKECEACPAVAQ